MQLSLINGDIRQLSFEMMEPIEASSQPLKSFWPALGEHSLDSLEKKIEKIFAILRLPKEFTLEHVHTSRVNRASEANSYYYDLDEAYSSGCSWSEHVSHNREGELADKLITAILLSIYPEVCQIPIPNTQELSAILNQEVNIANVNDTDFEISYKFRWGREDYQLIDKKIEALGLKIIITKSNFQRSLTQVGDTVIQTLKVERFSLLNFDKLIVK